MFKNKKFNHEKIKEFGFSEKDGVYSYSTNIMNGNFKLYIEISKPNTIKTKITENETGEEYTLHLTDAEGTFVGQVREEYKKIITDISEKCCDMNVFKTDLAYKIIDYAKENYGDREEYLWERTPDNAVIRRKDNKKWYIAILTVRRDRLGFEDTEYTEIIDIRADREKVPELIKENGVFPAYHMNKKNWITLILDGTLNFDYICKKIDESYKLAGAKKGK